MKGDNGLSSFENSSSINDMSREYQGSYYFSYLQVQNKEGTGIASMITV